MTVTWPHFACSRQLSWPQLPSQLSIWHDFNLSRDATNRVFVKFESRTIDLARRGQPVTLKPRACHELVWLSAVAETADTNTPLHPPDTPCSHNSEKHTRDSRIFDEQIHSWHVHKQARTHRTFYIIDYFFRESSQKQTKQRMSCVLYRFIAFKN